MRSLHEPINKEKNAEIYFDKTLHFVFVNVLEIGWNIWDALAEKLEAKDKDGNWR